METNDHQSHHAVVPMNNGGGAQYIVSRHNKKVGLIWLVTPSVVLTIVLSCYSVVSIVFRNTSAGLTMSSVGAMINVILGLLGVAAIVGIIIGIPIGIIYLTKKELAEGSSYDERSGKGDLSVVPEEIQGWNWGAAGLTWMWGLWHGVFMSLLIFVPVLGWAWWIVLGIKGNEWAWRNARWESVAVFKASQRTWNIAGLVVFLLRIIFVIGIAGFMATLAVVSLESARMKARDTKRIADVIRIQTALELYYADNVARYPESITLGQPLSNQKEVYMSLLPLNPRPNDGSCPEDFEYSYTSRDQGVSYELTYCLGEEMYGKERGMNTVTP